MQQTGADKTRRRSGNAPGAYEREGGERIARGSVALPSGFHWQATIEVPLRGDRSALLTLQRMAESSLEPAEAVLAIPPGEAGAVLTLLTGILRQARKDGLLR